MRRPKDVTKMTKREFRDHLYKGRLRVINEWNQINSDTNYYNEHCLPDGCEPLPLIPMPQSAIQILRGIAAQLIVMDAELGIGPEDEPQ